MPGPNHHGFAIGSTFDHIVNGTPGSLAALGMDLYWSLPITLPFASGQWWVPGFTLGTDVLGGSGDAVRTYAIPNVPALVGQHLTFQSLVFDVTTGRSAFTNAADCFVGP